MAEQNNNSGGSGGGGIDIRQPSSNINPSSSISHQIIISGNTKQHNKHKVHHQGEGRSGGGEGGEKVNRSVIITQSSGGGNGPQRNDSGMMSSSRMKPPKTSSFQITSVTVGPRPSTDNGEDSADDLDESHTDENSRVTDQENETPSFSEDTFSKEDVFFSSNAIGTAPVIPTSSQYGLAIVSPDLNGQTGMMGQNLVGDVHVSVIDGGAININVSGMPAMMKQDGHDLKEMQHRNERFKVVKIESTEPFKRGRWVCMDYLDHTTLQSSSTTNGASAESTAPTVNGTLELPETDSSSNNNANTQESKDNNPVLQQGQTAPAEFYHHHNAQQQAQQTSISPGQTMTNSEIPQSLPPQQLQQILLQSNINVGGQRPQGGGDGSNQQSPQIEIQHIGHHQGQSQPAQFYSQQQQQQSVNQPQFPSPQPLPSSNVHPQGVTLPADFHQLPENSQILDQNNLILANNNNNQKNSILLTSPSSSQVVIVIS